MSDETISLIGVGTGFVGLLVVVGTIGVGKAVLERWFPKWKEHQVYRMMTILIFVGGLLAVGGTVLAVRQDPPPPPCPEDMGVADVCY